MRRKWGCLAVILICSQNVLADATTSPDKDQYTLFNPTPADQLRDMDTDRPNKTNTPHTIDAGHLQIETGVIDYGYFRDRSDGSNTRVDSLGIAQFNFRLGVLNDLEVNAIVNSYDFMRTRDIAADQTTRQGGFGDLIVGGKYNFWGNEAGEEVWKTAFGVQPQFKIPTAPQELGNGHTELFVGFPFLVNLPDEFHLGLQTTVSWERNSSNDGYVTGWQNSVSIDRVLVDKFDVYLEYWSHTSTEEHQGPQQTLDVGFTYPVTDNLMLDTGVNFGLNRASENLEITAGVSVRF